MNTGEPCKQKGVNQKKPQRAVPAVEEHIKYWPFPTKLPPAQPAKPIPFNLANHEDALW